MSNHEAEEAVEGIAVIGMSGSYPGANDIDEFWRNICEGVESISSFDEGEHDRPPWADPAATYVPAKGVLESAEWFDAGFFGYSPEEANSMDPQHRVFLERGWEAMEHAGYDTSRYDGLVGVFAGVSANTYLLTNIFRRNRAARALMTDKDFVATRLAYKLNLRGPAIVVQSACSTSLVAVCLACQSLLNYQCDMAVAGGATIWAPTKSGYPYHAGGPLSPDGHCRTFDAMARGFVPGSGAGAIVLKRLCEALEDGDTIAAVIKGFAINNDGSGKVGYAAPSIDGQAEVILAAQQLAEIDPATITYIEAHGTGTEMGDPIEIAALTQAFRQSTEKNGYCAIGSVKPNIGHLDAAAGVAGLTKAVLAVQNAQLPPSVNFTSANPAIDFANSPFFVNKELTPWRTQDAPRRAGVSAFGIGGTNAHVVLEEPPATAESEAPDAWNALLVSAASEAALEDATSNLADFLEKQPDASLSNTAYTLQVGRRRFPYRRVLACRNREEAISGLRNAASSCETRVGDEEDQKVAFLFPGQAAQYPNMARGLYDRYAAFRDTVDRCCNALQADLGFDLREALFPTANDESAAERLTSTDVAQPAIFVVEYALAQLWKQFGLTPAACLGHSIGEYVAACVAGVFQLEDALRIVAGRGRLMSRMRPGAMLAVQLSEKDVQPWLDADIALAAINAPSLTVLSGPAERIEGVEAQLASQGATTVRLKTSHAFHSSMMEPMLDEFEQLVASVPRRSPELPFISNLTGDWVEEEAASDPAYWREHVRSTVRFSEGLEQLGRDAQLVLLEAGPGRTLSSLAQLHAGSGQSVISSTRHPRDDDDDHAVLLRAAGKLWMSGANLDWAALHAPHHRSRIPLPTYPFQRTRYWACDEFGDEGPAFAAENITSNEASDRFYASSWKRSASRGGEHRTDRDRDAAWLVFSDETDLASRLVEELEKRHDRCVVVEAGEAFEIVSPQRYRIRPDDAADYRELIGRLEQAGTSLAGVAHCWNCNEPAEDSAARLRLGRVGFYSLLYFAQAVAASGVLGESIPIHVIANGLFEVIGGEQIVAENSLLLGPCRVLPQEFPNLHSRVIDLPTLGASGGDELAVQVATELVSDSQDAVVAFRHGYRWVQDYESTPLEEPAADAAMIKTGGVYLITGGMGGMGLVLAKWLAEEYQARLVLTARTELPERSTWDDYTAANGEDDATSRRILGVKLLEDAGAEVRVFAADVCDAAQMRQVVDETVSKWGAIHGAIHAAGVAGGGVAQLKTAEMAERVLAPKVEGTRVLQYALADQPLDFMVLCSSISSLAGGVGQIDYCAANAFLDAAAWEAHASGGPCTIAINWNAWNEVGMAVETDLPAHLKALKAELGLADSVSNAEGVDAFRRILADRTQPQVAVTLNDLPRFLRLQSQANAAQLTQGSPGLSQAKPELATPYVEPRTNTESAVAEIWETLFGFEPIGVQDDYFELGGHSLMALQMIDQLRANLGADLVLGDLFEHKTIESLSRRIDADLWARDQAVSENGSDPDRETSVL